MSKSNRRNRRAVAHLSGSVCAAWLIAVAGASQSIAAAPAAKPAAKSGGHSGKSRTGGSKAPMSSPGSAKSLPMSNPTDGTGQDRDPFSTAGANSSVKVSEYQTVDLHVQDEDLANVLQMLSLQSQRNIVVSKDVSATVSANLYNVTFYEALDAILNVNGYGYLERGNFIFVYTLDELAQIEQAQRKPVTKVMKLNYLNANDAAEFVAPLLSEVGQIKTNGDVGAFAIQDKLPQGDEQFAMAATLVVYDYPEHVEEIEKLVSQLDTRPQQVLVEATILQTSLNEANAFGIDFSLIGNVDFTDFIGTGGPLSAANALVKGGNGSGGEGFSPPDNKGQAYVSTAGNTAGPSTFKLGVVHDDFAIFMKLLDEVTDVSILSNPKILTLNRQPARVLVGQRLGYLNTTSTETSTTQTVQFLDTGTQLAFRPFISTDGMIRMELSPSVSEGVIRNQTNTTGANVSIPDEITQSLTTNVIVRDGSTIVLGGLFKESTTLGRRQVPIVGDIPIIGLAFQGHDDSTVRSEIIFLIKPTIMNDQRLADDGQRAMAYTERVRAGSRAGLLPFSRDRMTSQLNLEAEELGQKGDSEEALWKIRRSLELNPDQPVAIALREKLTSERVMWPSRSLLDYIVDDKYINQFDTIKPVPPEQHSDADTAPAPTTSPSAKADTGSKSASDTKAQRTASAATPELMGPFLPGEQDGQEGVFGPWPLGEAPAWTQAEAESFIPDPFALSSGGNGLFPMDLTSWTLPFRMGDPKFVAWVDEKASPAGDQRQSTPAFTNVWRALMGLPADAQWPEQQPASVPALTNVPTDENPRR